MGAGAYHYEALHDFLQPPHTLKFGDTRGIVVTADGRIVLCHTVHQTSESPDAIVIFDPDGAFIKSWGADLRGGAHGLVLRREGSTEYLYDVAGNRSEPHHSTRTAYFAISGSGVKIVIP